MLLGDYDHNLDEKGRITVPAKFRARLAPGLVVTKGIDSCVWLWPADAFSDLLEKIKALPVTDPDTREFRRWVLASASDLVPDKQGRFVLPQKLREYAHIDKQAVILGLDNYCEIWNPECWRERQQRHDSDPDGLARQFANLGI